MVDAERGVTPASTASRPSTLDRGALVAVALLLSSGLDLLDSWLKGPD